MKKTSTTIKKAIVLDFDGTIYWNRKEDYSVDINFHNIIDAKTFFSELSYQIGKNILATAEIILVSGRPAHQEKLIVYLLKQKGYNITKSYFLPDVRIFPNFQGDENTFLTHYWFWKVKVLNEIRQSQKYSSIIVIDNDNVICSMLRELNFGVIKAHFESWEMIPQIFFTPLSQGIFRIFPLIISQWTNHVTNHVWPSNIFKEFSNF